VVTLINSTVSDKAADDNGGGIYTEDVGSTINLRSSNVAFNYAIAGGVGTNGAGAGINNARSTVNLPNSILSNSGVFWSGWTITGATSISKATT
jgi:hypothetical protein